MGGQHRFMWHDLMAGNVEGAKKFYGELFGWTFNRGGNDDEYTEISAGGEQIGGIVSHKGGYPPHWIGYVSTDDVDAMLAKVKEGGGKVFVNKTAIPKVGEFAVAADPTGAMFSPLHYTGEGANAPEPSGPPKPYTFCWDELVTKDPDAAGKFYQAVTGWKPQKMEEEKYGGYVLLKRPGTKDEMGEEKAAAGMMKAQPEVPVSFWLTYISVENCDATVEKAGKLGGKVVMPAMDIPDVGRFACFLDPENASFAVLQPNARK